MLFSKQQYSKPGFINDKEIGIISPSSPCPEFIPEKIHRGCVNIEKMGFRVRLDSKVYEEYPETEEGYMKRACVINSLFADKAVGGIICKTGGSGAINVLKYLDNFTIQSNQKMVCGYSDNTSLLMYLNDRLKLVVFHGPTLVPGMSDLDDVSRNYFIKVCSENNYPVEIKSESFISWNKGRVTGKLIGGNLTRLVEYLHRFPDTTFKNKILFLEETGENSMYIDSRFTFLKEKRFFKGVKGVLFGHFKGAGENELSNVKRHLLDILGIDQVPVLYGFTSGHCKEKIILPFGTDVTIDASEQKVVYEECPFSSANLK
jgi:muramoyltetrapeptide carboxypeptidase